MAQCVFTVLWVVAVFEHHLEEGRSPYHAIALDGLTGALNRMGLQQAVCQFIEQSSTHSGRMGQEALDRGQAELNLFCVDIKAFRKLRSAYGQSVADVVLRQVFADFKQALNDFGELARVHVDQFVALVPAESYAQARQAFDAFWASGQSALHEVAKRRVQVQLLATEVVLGPVHDASVVMDTLDASLRETQARARRNTSRHRVLVQPEQAKKLVERSQIIRNLRQHQLPSNLCIAWQPMVAVQDRGEQAPIQNRAEALLRLRSADGQLESAAFLLDACVEHGLTRFIDHWVLDHSLQFLDAHEEALQGLEFLSINVLPSSLNDELFLSDVLALLRAHPHAAARLCLEITEVGAVYNFLGVKNFIAEAQALGVKIALDDFGAGFSNYQYAIDLDLDLIKIDGGIVSTLCQSRACRAVVASIVKLAQDLGCECVAEWVEDQPTLDALRTLNVPYVQGHLLAPALDPSAFFNAPQCAASSLCANLKFAS